MVKVLAFTSLKEVVDKYHENKNKGLQAVEILIQKFFFFFFLFAPM